MVRKRGRKKEVTFSNSQSATFSENGQSANIINSTVIVGQSTIGSFSPGEHSAQERNVADSSSGHSLMFGDIFVHKKRAKEGSRVFTGFQKHASGQTTPVAIKVISPFDEKNLREVEHLVTLTPHPNVVAIIRSKKLDGHVCSELYIVMELCSSGTLKDYCENTPFDFDQIMSYCKQLLGGIKHIHDNRIIHGDLKPENILFSLDGKFIKVSDFGISKQLQRGKSKTKCTSPGTDSYRAPETFNSDVISMSADIYSLGIVLFGAFTRGSHPFGRDRYLQVYNMKENIGQDFSALPAEMGPTKQTQFCNLLRKMLNIDPRRRPTISQVWADPFFKNSSRALVEEQRPVQWHRKSFKLIQRQKCFIITLLTVVIAIGCVFISSHGGDEKTVSNLKTKTAIKSSYEREDNKFMEQEWESFMQLYAKQFAEIELKLDELERKQYYINTDPNLEYDSDPIMTLGTKFLLGCVDIRPFYNSQARSGLSSTRRFFRLHDGLLVCFGKKRSQNCKKYKEFNKGGKRKSVSDLEVITFPLKSIDAPNSSLAFVLWFERKLQKYVVVSLCDEKVKYKSLGYAFTIPMQRFEPVDVLPIKQFIGDLHLKPSMHDVSFTEFLLYEIIIETGDFQKVTLKIYLH